MLADAEENAKALLANARDDAAKAAREYAIQVEAEAQRAGGDEAPGVRCSASLCWRCTKSAWRASTTSPASVLRIPSRLFPARSLSPLPSRSQSRNPSPSTGRSPGPSLRLSRSRSLSQSRSLCPSLWWSSPKWSLPPRDPELPQEEPTLQDKVDYSREQLRQEPHSYHPDDNDLSQVGIDLEAYSDIPESLQREKALPLQQPGVWRRRGPGPQKAQEIKKDSHSL